MRNQHVQSLIGGILNDAADRLVAESRLRAVVAAYKRAKDDPQTRIPSYLMAALEAASRE